MPHDAAVAFYDTLLASLRFDLKIACYVGLAVAGAAVLAGTSPAAERIRRGAAANGWRKLADEAVGESVTAKWVAANPPDPAHRLPVIFGLLFAAVHRGPIRTCGCSMKLARSVMLVALRGDRGARPPCRG